jgi:hypothetical protein
MAILGFELSPMAYRGLLEQITITMAVAALTILQSVARSPTNK